MFFLPKIFRKKEKQDVAIFEDNNDDIWQELNNVGIQHASNLDWGLYTSNIFQKGDFLYKEKKYNKALELFLEVLYLDLNGPTNSNKEKDMDLLSEYPMWDKKLGFIAPGVVKKIHRTVSKVNIPLEEIEKYFFEKSKINYQNLKLPINPNEAWERLKNDILGKN